MISVVIPTYHRNDSLSDCLDCLRAEIQGFSTDQFEVIVTDDGIDSTAETLLRERYNWVKWTRGPRRGPSANRNHGATIARGDWIVFTDDDCLPTVSWLRAFSAAISPDCSIYEGRTICAIGLRSILEDAPVNLSGGNLWSCNMMLARTAFETLGGFDDRFPHAAAEDLEFHRRVLACGYKVLFVPDATIDHPPRPRKVGIAAGKLWEGRVLLQVLYPDSLPSWLPFHVLRVRLSQMTQFGFEWASIRFGIQAIVETIFVFICKDKWESRYSGAVCKHKK
jgi:GT2 family glycosyltransferase